MTFFDGDNRTFPSSTYEGSLYKPVPRDTYVFNCQMNSLLFFLIPKPHGTYAIIELVLVSFVLFFDIVSISSLVTDDFGRTIREEGLGWTFFEIIEDEKRKDISCYDKFSLSSQTVQEHVCLNSFDTLLISICHSCLVGLHESF